MRTYSILVAAALVALASGARAAEFQPLGTLGIGGAGVARQNGALTAYWNPAAGAFNDKTFAFATGAQVGMRGNNGLTEDVDQLSKIDFNNIKSFDSTTANATTVGNTLQLITILDDIQRKNGNLALNATAPVGFAIRHFSFGVFGNLEGYAQPLADTVNILPKEVSTSTAITATSIYNAVKTDPNINVQGTYFNAAERQSIQNVFTANGLTSTQAAQVTNVIESQLQGSGLAASSVASTVSTTLNTALASGNGATLDKNTSSVMTKALLYVEVPIAYGHPFDLGRFGILGVGAALKVISGTVYQNQVLLVNRADGTLKSQDLIHDITKNSKNSVNVGLDLGALWKKDHVSVGLVMKNLNAPSFEGPDFQAPIPGNPAGTTTVKGSDVTLDPQVRMGVAYDPLSWLTIAADLDLTENEAVVPSASVKSRNLGGGIELHPYWWLKFRLGAYTNLAASDSGPVATAGLSLGPIDLDVAAATDTFKVGSATVPQEVKAQLMGSFSF